MIAAHIDPLEWARAIAYLVKDIGWIIVLVLSAPVLVYRWLKSWGERGAKKKD